MAIQAAFAPTGNTVAITPSTSNQPVTVSTFTVPGSLSQIRVNNLSGVTVYIALGATAVIPVSGTPSNGIPISAGQVEVLTNPAGSTPTLSIGVIGAAAGSGNIYFTPGEGI